MTSYEPSAFRMLGGDYDPQITYGHVKLDFYAEGSTLSTQAQKAVEVWKQQKAFLYHENPQQLPAEKLQAEKVLLKVIPNKDGRERIMNTTEWPHVIHAQLTMKFGRATCGGSGAMVGPHHVLTCGHNVYDPDKKKWADSVIVCPALNEQHEPFGEVQVTRIYIFSDWKDKGDPKFDIALLVLNFSIGKFTGWGGLLCLEDDEITEEHVNIVGYPGDKGTPKCTQMWGMKHKIREIEPETFEYDIDTFSGQSGSAIWINKFGTPHILGVHTLGGDAANHGVRISKQKFIALVQVISETYKLATKDIDLHMKNDVDLAAMNAMRAGSRNAVAPANTSSIGSSTSSCRVANHVDDDGDLDPNLLLGLYDEKQQELLTTIASDPSNGLAYGQLADTLKSDEKIFLLNGREVSKKELYVTCLAFDLTISGAFFNLAQLLAEGETIRLSGHLMNNKDLYVRYIALKPNDPDGYLALAESLADSESISWTDQEQANKKQLYLRCIELDPTQAAAIFNLAQLLSHRETVSLEGKSMNKKDLYVQYVALQPHDADGYFALASTLSKNETVSLGGPNKWNEQQLYYKCVELDPTKAEAYVDLANTLSDKQSLRMPNGSIMKDQQLYLKAIELNPNLAGAHFMLASKLLAGESIRLPNNQTMNQQQLFQRANQLDTRFPLDGTRSGPSNKKDECTIV